jgi:hypothetical protein
MSKGTPDRTPGTVISAGNPDFRSHEMRSRSLDLLAIAAVALTALVGSVATASAATVRHFEGRVLSVDRDAKSFRLRDSERGTFTVFVTRSTRFDRTSFAKVKTGRSVEVTVRRADGRWQATKVEPRTGGGREAEPGDDNGGGRGGNDDGPNHS